MKIINTICCFRWRMLLFIATFFTYFISLSIQAEPYLAQRYGQKCSACHTNITGGGKRSETGFAYAMSLSDSLVTSKLSPKMTDAISIGANLRADWTYTQFDDPEANSDGVIGDEFDDTSAFSVSNGAMYLQFDLSEKITFYIDQQVAPEGGRTREALGIYRGLAGDNDYIKVGKFFLPYGLRLQDDKAFIREATGYNFDNSDIGAEYGYESGPWSVSVALTNGTQGAGENNTDKQFSSVLSYVQPKYRVGVSAAKNNSTNGIREEAFNVFAGLTLGKWVFLAEIDRVEKTSGNPQEEPAVNLISFLSANYLIRPSTNIKLSYEYLDPNDDIDENERTRVSLLGETFLNQFSQLRYGVRRYDGIVQDTFQNQSIAFTEFHVFF